MYIVKKTVNTHTHACDIVYDVILFIELPYGDQGLFMWRNTFDSVGGYPIYRLMEDFEMVCMCVYEIIMMHYYRLQDSRR